MYAQNQSHIELQLCAFEEEVPMTMQVGMVGTDGILVASDTLWQEVTRYRHGHSSTKRDIDLEHKIVISRARDYSLSRQISDALMSSLKDVNKSDLPNLILVIEAIAANTCQLSPVSVPIESAVECLIVLYAPIPRLLYLERTLGKFRCELIEDKIIAGDRINSSIYFVERYYRPLPIRQLAPLAVQLVVSAALLYPRSFSGLEITLCDSSGIHPLPSGDVAAFKAKACELDKTIENILFSDEKGY